MAKPKQAPLPSAAIAAELEEWKQITKWLDEAGKRELALRVKLAAHFCPNPKEGTNTIQGAGFEVKVISKVNRTLDEATLNVVMMQLPEQYRHLGTLINYKPSFSKDVYKAMSEADRKIFDQALTISSGTPTLEITMREEAPAPPQPAAKPSKPKPPAKPVAKPAKKPNSKKK